MYLHHIRKIYNKIEPKFPLIRILRKVYRAIMPLRYTYLLRIIKNNKCKRIMEIGVLDGGCALQMIEEAKKNFAAEEIEYYGFDLFEEVDAKSEEYSHVKLLPTLGLGTIKDKLEKTNAKIYLYKGDTKETLPTIIKELPKMDLIFIDGGHDIETIENDWKYAQQVMGTQTVVIFDDYWNREDAGCKRVIEDIDKTKFEVKILPIQDKFKEEWGTLKINFVQVKSKTNRNSIRSTAR